MPILLYPEAISATSTSHLRISKIIWPMKTRSTSRRWITCTSQKLQSALWRTQSGLTPRGAPNPSATKNRVVLALNLAALLARTFRRILLASRARSRTSCVNCQSCSKKKPSRCIRRGSNSKRCKPSTRCKWSRTSLTKWTPRRPRRIPLARTCSTPRKIRRTSHRRGECLSGCKTSRSARTSWNSLSSMCRCWRREIKICSTRWCSRRRTQSESFRKRPRTRSPGLRRLGAMPIRASYRRTCQRTTSMKVRII